MNKAEKTKLATELKDKFSKAKVAIFSDYKGITATQADELRRSLRAQNTEVKVLKNNIARLITKDGAFGDDAKAVMDALVGPTLVSFGYGDPAAAAKIVHKFSKDYEAFKIKDSLLGKVKMSASNVEELASLPGREVLLAKLLGTMNAPVTNFVSVLAAVPRGLVTVLAAIEKKKANPQA
jgi:large subunit ribosomal protein L10